MQFASIEREREREAKEEPSDNFLGRRPICVHPLIQFFVVGLLCDAALVRLGIILLPLSPNLSKTI